MNKQFLLSSLLILAAVANITASAGIKVVVLGSSTAAGAGVADAGNAWVNRYAAYLQTLDPANQVINLAKGGYTTCAIMPTGTPGYQAGDYLLEPDTERNIDKALSYNPSAIIINMPTNDVSNGIPVDTQMQHFKTIVDMAEASGVKVWITTSQPHNFGETYDGPYTDDKQPDVYKQVARDQFKELTERILDTYSDRAIDFYTDIATVDGYSFIRPEYDSGDGVHLNDDAHAVLFEKVKAKNIPSQVDSDIFGGILANPVYLNFGPVETVGIDNWNCVYGQAAGFSVSPLVDCQGISTSLSITLATGFTHAASNGSSSAVMEMNDIVSMSNFSSNSADAPRITFAGMSPDQVYDFSVFASRAASDNRECIYTFEGAGTVTVSLDAASNSSVVATAASVVPDEQGIITMTITRGDNNNSGFCYINAMKITSSIPPVTIPEGAVNVETPGTLATLLTQPVEEITRLVLYGSLNGTDIKTIMSMTALEVLDMQNTRIVTGGEAYLNGMTTRDNIFPQEMFYNNKVIKQVLLPAGITELKYHTFMGADALESVRIPDTVHTFGNDLFSGCSMLSEVNIPKNLTSMGSGCFWNCKKIVSLTFPETLTVIPGGSFYGCSSLQQINLPESLTSVEGDWTFAGCNALKEIVLGPSVQSLPAGAFYNCWSLEKICCKMSELPVIDTKNGDTPFTGAFKPQNCTLIVPFTSYDLYKNDAVWGVMANLYPLANVWADGIELAPSAESLAALSVARDLVVTGSTPDADGFSDCLKSNACITSVDLTGVNEYCIPFEIANPNCLTYVDASFVGDADNLVKTSATDAAVRSLKLIDGYDFACKRSFIAIDAVYTRTFDEGWTTLAIPFDAENNGAWIERYDETEGSDMKFVSVDNFQANKAYLVNYQSAGEKIFSASQVTLSPLHSAAVQNRQTEDSADSDVLIPNFLTLSGNDVNGKYVLVSNSTNQSFVLAENDSEILPFRAYRSAAGLDSYNIVHSPVPTSQAEVMQDAILAYASDGILHIKSDKPRYVSVYAVDGRCVRTITLSAGDNTVRGLNRGIYIVGNRKIMLY